MLSNDIKELNDEYYNFFVNVVNLNAQLKHYTIMKDTVEIYNTTIERNYNQSQMMIRKKAIIKLMKQ